MIELNDVIDFIEHKYSLRLFEFQKQMLGAIVNGQIVLAPRCCGKTMLINGYRDYLEEFYKTQPTQFDCQVGGLHVARTGLLSLDLMKKAAKSAQRTGREHVFEREYVVNIQDVLEA